MKFAYFLNTEDTLSLTIHLILYMLGILIHFDILKSIYKCDGVQKIAYVYGWTTAIYFKISKYIQ